MKPDLFPPFLPERPHSFWLFLAVTFAVLCASIGLKAPSFSTEIADQWYQESPVAIADFSTCPHIDLEKIRTDAHQKFPEWRFIRLRQSSFQKTFLQWDIETKTNIAKQKMDHILTVSSNIEGAKNLAALPLIEKFLENACGQASVLTLPEDNQKEVILKSDNLLLHISKISYFLKILAVCIYLPALFFWGKARFSLPLPYRAIIAKSRLSALSISLKTIWAATVSVALGIVFGLFFADLCSAYFAAHFFEIPFAIGYFQHLKNILVALRHLHFAPDLLLILVILGLYCTILFFFLWNLGHSLQKQRQVRIFLSDNNPF